MPRVDFTGVDGPDWPCPSGDEPFDWYDIDGNGYHLRCISSRYRQNIIRFLLQRAESLYISWAMIELDHIRNYGGDDKEWANSIIDKMAEGDAWAWIRRTKVMRRLCALEGCPYEV